MIFPVLITLLPCINAAFPEFLAAVKNGKSDEVRSMLAKDESLVKQTNYTELYPLNYAITFGHLDVVKALVEAKADLERVGLSRSSPTALRQAVFQGKVELVKYLIDAKAEVDSIGLQGLTPLGYASKMGRTDVAAVLSEAKANIEHVDHLGRTPLFLAVEANKAETVKMLVEAKANVNAVNYKGVPALYVAITTRSTSVDTVELLIKNNADTTVLDPEGHNAMAVAIIFDRYDIVDMMLQLEVKDAVETITSFFGNEQYKRFKRPRLESVLLKHWQKIVSGSKASSKEQLGTESGPQV